ncbi:hypothetical protein T439DRAFT_326090 [Meredithblackwellia eburnea MCA 4105]
MVAVAAGRTLTFIFILPAFLFFLFISISTPVTSNFNFLNYTLGGTKALKVGMYGSCTWDVSSTGRLSGKVCTKAALPWLVNLQNLPGRINNSNPYVGGKLSIPLVLYPVATGLAFLGVLTAFVNSKLALLNCQGAAGLGGAAMVIEFILFIRTDGQVRQAFSGNITGGLGICTWLGLVAPILAGCATLSSILGTAKETRVHGSLIKPESEHEGKRRLVV